MSFYGKTVADNLYKLEIWWLKKYGYLDGYRSGKIIWKYDYEEHGDNIGITSSVDGGDSKYLTLSYTQTDHDGNKENLDYQVRLTTTPCNFGGYRYWFICPLSKNGITCNKRVGVLYLGDKYFGCRHCYDLTYDSKNRNRRSMHAPLFQAMYDSKKADELRKQIKRCFYNGKPTRKFKRFLKLRGSISDYVDTIKKD